MKIFVVNICVYFIISVTHKFIVCKAMGATPYRIKKMFTLQVYFFVIVTSSVYLSVNVLNNENNKILKNIAPNEITILFVT